MKISITSLTGKNPTLKAESSDPIENVNSNVSDDGDAQISVTTLTGKTISVEVVKSNKVVSQDYRAKERKERYKTPTITPEHQRKDGMILADDIDTDMQIYVLSVKDKVMGFKVKGSDTVEKLKCKIRDKEGIPLEEQTLLFAGREVKDGETLADCNVRAECTLRLVYREGFELLEDDEWGKIFVKTMTGRFIPLEFKGSVTVLTVKYRLEDIQGVPPHQQRLIYKNKPLEDGRTLTQCNIKHGCTLNFVLILRG